MYPRQPQNLRLHNSWLLALCLSPRAACAYNDWSSGHGEVVLAGGETGFGWGADGQTHAKGHQ